MDALQKISDAPLVDCPVCGRPALQKLISAAGFRLKGGGWYETDFKQRNQKNLHETARKAEAKPGAEKSGAKSKPDAKKSAVEKKAAG
jgi:putative FmdB family regulatory protein